MLINEAGLVRAIKRAYKHGGYVVANLGDALEGVDLHKEEAGA